MTNYTNTGLSRGKQNMRSGFVERVNFTLTPVSASDTIELQHTIPANVVLEQVYNRVLTAEGSTATYSIAFGGLHTTSGVNANSATLTTDLISDGGVATTAVITPTLTLANNMENAIIDIAVEWMDPFSDSSVID